MTVELKPGMLCRSKKGRDSGRYFLIQEVVDESYVLLTDGKLRKTAKPKLKKIKHIEPKPYTAEAIAEKFKSGVKVFDAEIASAIKAGGYSEEE